MRTDCTIRWATGYGRTTCTARAEWSKPMADITPPAAGAPVSCIRRIDILRVSEKFDLENVNHPGQVKRVDASMYEAMKRAFLKVLPKTSPGLTEAEIRQTVLAHLPQDLFPKGAKAGWWTKAVQLH